MLKGRKILLGVTGGIAAYKAAVIIRLLVKEGAEVKVIMTPLAKEFITPLTLATLSKNPIFVDFFDPEDGRWNSHIELGLWADLFLIAPATANTMGKMASGIADNLLLTTWLSARCPVFLAPAVDLDMLAHPATAGNIEKLKSFGCHIIEPDTGELASGLEGKGRMAEPEAIVRELSEFLSKKKITELPLWAEGSSSTPVRRLNRLTRFAT
jgi:phosphopantothenoylcysteine decarboxylase/phosphopantothenate--cysteine ligase